MKVSLAKRFACCAASAALACSVVPAGAAFAADAENVQDSAAAVDDQQLAADKAKALIEPLATLDAFDISEDDRARIDEAQGAYDVLDEVDKQVLDAQVCPGGKQSYGRVLESAVWGLGLLTAVDNATALPDGAYTAEQVASASDKGKYVVTTERTWSAVDVVVKGGKAFATVQCNETGKYPSMRMGNTVFEANVTTDDEGKNHSRFLNVPVDLNATVPFAVKSSYAGSVVYRLITETPIEKTADKAVNAKPALKSLAKGKKAFTAKWGKKSGVTGYELQYATNKKFTSGKKTVKVKGAAKTSKKVGNLKAKKAYYVRVRSYTKVGPGTCYSQWTSVKKVTTKK